jgi:hypothetical protein
MYLSIKTMQDGMKLWGPSGPIIDAVEQEAAPHQTETNNHPASREIRAEAKHVTAACVTDRLGNVARIDVLIRQWPEFLLIVLEERD